MAVGAQEMRVEVGSIGHRRLGPDPVAHRPVPEVYLEIAAVCVAAGIGRIIPTRVIHEAPVQKLSARVVGVGIVVEVVNGGELADLDDDVVLVAGFRDLVGDVGKLFPFTAQIERLLEQESGEIRSRLWVAYTNCFTIAGSSQAEYVASTKPAGDLRVDDQEAPFPRHF